jgi:predicted ATPase
MKICKVVIENYQQFKHLELDFTHPETGEPLDKICFIGSNGTGKSTLLKLLWTNLAFMVTSDLTQCSLHIELSVEGKRLIWGIAKGRGYFKSKEKLYEPSDEDDLVEIYNQSVGDNFVESGLQPIYDHLKHFAFHTKNLLIKVEAESDANYYKTVQDVPSASLDDAIGNGKLGFAGYYILDQSNVADFWKRVIYHTAQRETERNKFENFPENLQKTKRQLIDEFDAGNPKILDKLAGLWNRILEKCGLAFDVDNAKLPIQLTDNLHAYIKLKATGERINYNQLSTGIRNFIFRIGHIYSLYFNREIENGFLFVDEPENSLFPDFLLDLIDIYQEITTDKNGHRNTQMFFATHNPIVAAQFEPHERVVLEWTDEGDVVAHRGVAPLGDDPNDLLVKDFGISSLMPKAGVEKWQEFLGLKRKLRHTTDEVQKEELVTKILELGTEYNFPAQPSKP